ncbi:MAG: hypothetical protein H2038_09585 [Brevundimonas sp.]|uniref:hypothetical protein n=1 Tax=Brevundimonas sp. TaxID=1871086 RepID=UPI00181E0D25|nr:hypothetical protein [Brevundimonas sp.]MBA4804888.1 hypothetical protein [Brevundimonas sp.]
MVAAALAAAVLATAPQDRPGHAWGEQEWTYGRGPTSRHYFEYGDRYPSGHELAYGRGAGSFYYLIFGDQIGSAYFWRYGRTEGSAYFWRYGRTGGSADFWRYGRGCLSETGWREGAACTGAEVLVLQTACIAQVVDIAPCRAINARLDEWLANAGTISSRPPADVVAEMRRPLD